jgi:hypothetical protein
MRLLYLLLAITACDQGTRRPIEADPGPAPSRSDAALVEVVSDGATAMYRYTSVAEFFGLQGPGPGDFLAGFRLGHPRPDVEPTIEVTGWWVWSRAIEENGKVVHVIASIAPEHGDFGANENDLEPVLRDMRSVWGTPKQGVRELWSGPTAKLYAVMHEGALVGAPFLVFDLLPPGEDHVCGARDGFSTFFDRFKQILAKRDAAALAKISISNPDEGDSEECLEPGPGKTYFDCAAQVVARLAEPPSCNVSQGVYYWAIDPDLASYGYFVFSRIGTEWKVRGPLSIGHDTDPLPTAP